MRQTNLKCISENHGGGYKIGMSYPVNSLHAVFADSIESTPRKWRQQS